jgi:hypothetical protein
VSNLLHSQRFATVAAVSMLLLVGCSFKFTVLKDPKTGNLVSCQTDRGASFMPLAPTSVAQKAARACAERYEAAGYKIVK